MNKIAIPATIGTGTISHFREKGIYPPTLSGLFDLQISIYFVLKFESHE